MGKKIIGNQQGIALLVTLTVISVVMVSALEMNRRVRSAAVSAAMARDRMSLRQMASAGVHAAEAILVRDKKDSEYDSIQEAWADPEKVRAVLEDMTFDQGTITLTIHDELGKIQVNSLVEFPEGQTFSESQRGLWERFLNLLVFQNESLEDIEPTTIINSAKDWLDSGDDEAITGLNGAEADYYQDLDPPYICRNGPFTHIGEFALVRGVTEDLFNGTGETPGIAGFITIFGMTDTSQNKFTYTGKININTAEGPVLAAILPSADEVLAQAMYDYRQETSDNQYIHDLSSPSWYKNVPGLSDIEIDPNLITTVSDVFRIESVAALGDLKLKVTAVVKREINKKTGKWGCKVLRWEAE